MLALHWNDETVRRVEDLLDGDDRLRTPLFGLPVDPDAPIHRRWRQPGFPNEDLPVIFDTWVWLHSASTQTAGLCTVR